jgi:hypothetical protein
LPLLLLTLLLFRRSILGVTNHFVSYVLFLFLGGLAILQFEIDSHERIELDAAFLASPLPKIIVPGVLAGRGICAEPQFVGP